MTPVPEQEIALSKSKLIAITIGSIVFVVLGIWLMNSDASTARETHRSVAYLHGIGLAAILFFGLCGCYGAVKIFDRRPGLIFSEDGFTDHSSGVSSGFIPWSAVTGIRVFQISSQRSLVVLVADPQMYVARGNALQRAARKANLRICGSPIAISAASLKISFDDLLEIFKANSWRFGQKGMSNVGEIHAHS